MRHHLRKLPVFAFCVILTACCFLPFSDGIFNVTGRLTSKPNLCSIYLLSEFGEVVPYTEIPITEQDFNVRFKVEPCADTYEVVVSCNEVIRKRRFIRYGHELKLGESIDIGDITP